MATSKLGRALLATAIGIAIGIAPVGSAKAGTDHPVVIAAFAYHPSVVAIAAGDTMSVSNIDAFPHNIVSVDNNPATGQPWFRSALGDVYIGRDVSGVASTPPGSYLFTCDLHTFMTGVLVVA